MFKTYLSLSLLIVVLFIFQPPAHAQFPGNVQDVVYLKGGSIIRGELLEQNAEKLRIKLAGGSELVYNMEEVESVHREYAEKKVPLKGFGFYMSPGLMIGDGNYNAVLPSFQIVNGYRLKDGWYIGLGTGIEYFGTGMVPFFVDAKRVFAGTHTLLFVYTDFGYAWQLDDGYGSRENKGGITAGAGLGIRGARTNKLNLFYSIGYRHQSAKYVYRPNDNLREEVTELFNRVSFRVGITL